MPQHPDHIQKIIQNKVAYAAYPSAVMYDYVKNKFKAVKQLIFGDYVKPYINGAVPETTKKGNKIYYKVRSRGMDGFLLAEDLIPDRILEVNFIDVGQGDGCHVVMPDDKHFLIDAGYRDNMLRFLKWRFNVGRADATPPELTAVITHCDEDHYGGFTKIFDFSKSGKKVFTFDRIYQNGIVEESGKPYTKLGDIKEKNGNKYVTNLVKSRSGFNKRVQNVSKSGNYIKCLKATDAEIKFVKHGSKALYNKGGIKMEVLGPISEKIGQSDALIVFDKDKGRTKNGHSVILKLTIGKMRILLGGDLNSSSEKYLINTLANIDIDIQMSIIENNSSSAAQVKKAQQVIDDAILQLRQSFECDIAKSCHHGSADFTTDFLKIINPVATIISSGDDESHCHPRPETLGTVGKHSRGERSLIFSTELARSSKEFVETASINTAKAKERIVTVYGMINVRTDGEKAIVAQKLEKKSSAYRQWDINKLEWDDTLNQFHYVD